MMGPVCGEVHTTNENEQLCCSFSLVMGSGEAWRGAEPTTTKNEQPRARFWWWWVG